jgi:uncharacterized protein
MFQQTSDGTILAVKIIPKASRSEIVGWEKEELKIRIAAVPEKGEANEELVRFLAGVLDTAKSNIELMSGQTSRHKRLKRRQLSIAQLEEKF